MQSHWDTLQLHCHASSAVGFVMVELSYAMMHVSVQISWDLQRLVSLLLRAASRI